MTLSSRCCGGRYGLAAPSVRQEWPQDVDASACEREHCLGMALTFRSLPVVEPTGLRAAADTDECGRTKDALQPTVVALGPVEVAPGPAGATWTRRRVGEPRQTVGRGADCRVAVGGCHELGAQQGPDTRQTGDSCGEGVNQVQSACEEEKDLGLAGIGPGPYPAHRAPGRRRDSPTRRRPRRRRPTRRPVRDSRSAAESSRHVERPSALSHRWQPHGSHTRHPWVSQPYEWLAQPDHEGRTP